MTTQLLSAGPSSRRQAFTLIELLVVIAIISLLAAIMFPVFGTARDKARQSACTNNLKQIGLGIMQYLQDYDDSTPSMSDSGGNGRGWAGRIFPYIKSTQVFLCPSERLRIGGLGNANINGVNFTNYPVSYAYNQNLRGTRLGTSPTWGVGFKGMNIAAFSAPSQTVMLFEFDPNMTYAMSVPLLSPDESSSFGHTGASGGGWIAVMGPLDNATGYATFEESHLRHKSGSGGNFLFADGHSKFVQGTNISAGASPNLSTSAQYGGPGTCLTAEGSYPARCAEGVGYSGPGKHLGTMSYR